MTSEVLKRRNRHDRRRDAFSTLRALNERFDDEGKLNSWLETYNTYRQLLFTQYHCRQLTTEELDKLTLLEFAYCGAFGRFQNLVFKTADKVR